MSACPIEDAFHQIRAIGPERLLEGQGGFGVEIAELDRTANIERGALVVLAEGGRCCDAEQDEAQTLEDWPGGAGVVERSESGEEVIREGQTQHGVNLVEKQHDRPIDLHEQHILEKRHEASSWSQTLMLLPPLKAIDFESEAALDLVDDVGKPGLGVVVTAQGLEVYDPRSRPATSERGFGVNHEARLTGLARCQQEAQLPLFEGVQEDSISGPFNVAGCVGREGAADLEEFLVWVCCLGHRSELFLEEISVQGRGRNEVARAVFHHQAGGHELACRLAFGGNASSLDHVFHHG